jgi:RNA polymerase sigma-70 factor (ECF subfamily)
LAKPKGHEAVTELSISGVTSRDLDVVRAPAARDAESAREPADRSEAGLIERAKRDPQALTTLYRMHYAPIAGYVRRRVGNGHTAEDLTAEVFVTMLRTLRRYRYRGAPFRAWLYRIATNTVNRWARRERRRVERARARASAQVDGPDAPSDRAGPDVEAARRALLALKPKHQAVLALHYLEGLTVEDVASVIGVRIGTVKSRMSRAREALREELLRGR